jgi:exodeoxyribonuclease VII large subunit
MEQAMLEDIPLYYIFSNSTLEELAACDELSHEKLVNISGIGEKKMIKYGTAILSIWERVKSDSMLNFPVHENPVKLQNPSVLGVAECIASMNTTLRFLGPIRVRGEIFQWKLGAGGYVYFSLKDASGRDALLQCIVFPRSLSNLADFEEGAEVILTGLPDIYPKAGKLSLRVQTMELAGEWALKKAYDALKGELEQKGYFHPGNKPKIPEFIQKIGVITSLHGVVFEDFKNNIGKRGYRIECMDARVEGADAIRDIVRGIEVFWAREVDVIVLLRGGGSLESMSAFNSREVADAIFWSKKPIICGIGHDTDVPIACLVASKNYSTPSIVAKEIDKPHLLQSAKMDEITNRLFRSYDEQIRETHYLLGNSHRRLSTSIQAIMTGIARGKFLFETHVRIAREFLRRARNITEIFEWKVKNFSESLESIKNSQKILGLRISQGFLSVLEKTGSNLDYATRQLEAHNPERILRLGYSILLSESGKVVKKTGDVQSGDILVNRLSDGTVRSRVE